MNACCYCTPRGPPPSCLSSKPQKLVMRPGYTDHPTPFTFQMQGKNDVSNNVYIVPPTRTTKDGTKVTEISDPGREMFVLRIGNRSDGCEKKRLDLELCTPRPIYSPSPPEVQHRQVQYDTADFDGKSQSKATNKNGKGGEKKGKGGGGKKKK